MLTTYGILPTMPRIKPLRVALTVAVFVVLLAVAAFVGYMLHPAASASVVHHTVATVTVPRSQGSVYACNVQTGVCTDTPWTYTP